jgi:hypothetical protein
MHSFFSFYKDSLRNYIESIICFESIASLIISSLLIHEHGLISHLLKSASPSRFVRLDNRLVLLHINFCLNCISSILLQMNTNKIYCYIFCPSDIG